MSEHDHDADRPAELPDAQTFGVPGSAADLEAREARRGPGGRGPAGAQDSGDDQAAGFEPGAHLPPRNSPEPSDGSAPVDVEE
ncbi:MAG TPA: hypothetical protein VLQ79_05960 [Myxococcaceae bacterium]|nr:hypothetical protein [Myxococcaceae bacterium]